MMGDNRGWRGKKGREAAGGTPPPIRRKEESGKGRGSHCVDSHGNSLDPASTHHFFQSFGFHGRIGKWSKLIFQTSVLLDTIQYFDKRITDEETSLTQSDFDQARLRIRAKRETEETIDDSSMYNAERFEGDISPLRFFWNNAYISFSVNPGLTSKSIRGFVGDDPVVSVPGFSFFVCEQ